MFERKTIESNFKLKTKNANSEEIKSKPASFIDVSSNIFTDLRAIYFKDSDIPVTEDRLMSDINGIYAASVLFAFVIEDYFIRRKKVDEQLDKLYQIFLKRKATLTEKNIDSEGSTRDIYNRHLGREADSFFSKCSIQNDQSGKKPVSPCYQQLRDNSPPLQEAIHTAQNLHFYKEEFFSEPKEYPVTDSPPEACTYPSFIDMPLDADAKTILDMDRFLCNIEAVQVHEVAMRFLEKSNIGAIANCFFRAGQLSQHGDYKFFSEEVHSLPKGEKEYEKVYARSHEFLLQASSKSDLKNKLRPSDTTLVEALGMVSSASPRTMSSQASMQQAISKYTGFESTEI